MTRCVAAVVAALAVSLAAAPAAAQDQFVALRRSMVEQQIQRRGVTQPDVLRAMEQVPRHRFIPEATPAEAYGDQPVRLSSGASIYQPYVVALMTSLLELDGDDKVLEVGTGSGYHAAVLSRIARRVYSIEIVQSVADQARRRLADLEYRNVEIRVGDGYQGWPEKGPFDAILLSAAPPRIPQPLLDQLRVGGKMVVPVGGFFQDLQVITRTADGFEKSIIKPVRLSPMKGKVQDGQR